MNKTKSPLGEYKQLQTELGFKKRIREIVRDAAVSTIALRDTIPSNGNWIRFPYYHHIFSDECINFDKQLKLMKNFGDFISLDDAISILDSDRPLEGRHFCLTFDDGFKNCLTNAIPILKKNRAHATFFIPTLFIGSSPDDDLGVGESFFGKDDITIEFLTWEDCAEILREGMSIGAHSVSHKKLVGLSADEVKRELLISKKTIEEKLGIDCLHFCAPVGIPGRDFVIDRDPQIAKEVGYISFLTTRRGSIFRKSTPMFVERDHMIAKWNMNQVKYFFSR